MKNTRLLCCIAGMLALVVTAGCATTGSGGNDEGEIRAFLAEWESAILSANVEKMLATTSENFSHDGFEYEAESKDDFRDFVEQGIDAGNFDDVEISFDGADITFENGTANVYPIDYDTSLGAVVIGLTLVKEKGQWLVCDMDIEGM